MSELHYQRLTVKQLKEKLRRKDLRVSGKKQDLIDRLIAWERDNANGGIESFHNILLQNQKQAEKKENQMSDVEKHKMKRYLTAVMNDTNISSEFHNKNAKGTNLFLQSYSKTEYIEFVSLQSVHWEVALNQILRINIGKNKIENAHEYYVRICDEMDAAIEKANSLLESKKLELQRSQSNLLIFFAHFIGFSAQMYQFMKYLFENSPSEGWDNYRTYDFEVRRIQWILKQKKVSKQDAKLMKAGLQTVWKNFDLEYDGNRKQFAGQTKSQVIYNLFAKWESSYII